MDRGRTPIKSNDDTYDNFAELNTADSGTRALTLQINCNTRTPDLDGVARILRRNRGTPDSESGNNIIGNLFNISIEDTPVSQRESIVNGTPFVNSSSSPTKRKTTIEGPNTTDNKVLMPASSVCSMYKEELCTSLEVTVPDDKATTTLQDESANEIERRSLKRSINSLRFDSQNGTQLFNSPTNGKIGHKLVLSPNPMTRSVNASGIIASENITNTVPTQIIESPVHEQVEMMSRSNFVHVEMFNGSGSYNKENINHSEESTNKVLLKFSTKLGPSTNVSPTRLKYSQSPALPYEGSLLGLRSAYNADLYNTAESTQTTKHSVVYSEPNTSQELSEVMESSACNEEQDDLTTSEEKTGAHDEKNLMIASNHLLGPFRNRRKLTIEDDENDVAAKDNKLTKLPVAVSKGKGSQDPNNSIILKQHNRDTLLTKDNEFLTKNDIKYESSVWCYSANFEYYPAKILESHINRAVSLVLFKDGKYEVKNEDIHYLDLRVGEKVQWDHKVYLVESLEKRSEYPITCIRGYDTVYLRPLVRNGRSAKQAIIRPLMEIQLSLEQWARRPKIILESGSKSPSKAFEDLQQPIRRRKGTTVKKSITRTDIVSSPLVTDLTKDVGNIMATKNQKKVGLLKTVPSPSNLSVDGTNKIFSKCLFVITGLETKHIDYLTALINSNQGTVISRFSDYLKYENGKLKWIKDEFQEFKFACLIAENHIRTPRYLESLALGWPTLHWKFVSNCIKLGGVILDASIFPYLLPSGESHRLSLNATKKRGIIKSANISRFFMNLCKGADLKDQLDTCNVRKLIGLDVIILGSSDTDRFVEFVFSCFGVRTCEKVDSKNEIFTRLKTFYKDKNKLYDGNNGTQLLIYVNYTDVHKSEYIKSELIESINKNRIDNSGFHRIHVEIREWLIQTIINEDCGWN
ncbi:chromatin-binding protein RAD9 Ecym_4141 [Eremothecium cymbalariae DBVPG|uniref:BRCT domain-containing protein n=1 Tax=Eremothecium cymbalariae (strain CBS 270.75 / DBVPG 7215 / KCTC 17166 / NRRL Y-17582) TaxID=931890 RepID=G8JT67_ERECY|nr:hypothetical protein Ecym_4141 [Eremothecium cymbalariae DBVPG\